MQTPRTLLLVGLVAATVGCNRDYLRRDQARGSTPSPLARDFARGPMAAPMPPMPPPLPKPPAEPPVAPPRSDAVTGLVPAIPGSIGTTLDPSHIQHAEGEQFISTAEDRKRLLERIRERREEKREEKRDEKPKTELPSPFTPKDKDKETPKPTGAGSAAADVAVVKKLLDEFKKRFSSLTDFEARLIKREVINGKEMPQDEILYRYRVKPQSVYMKTLSDAGQGREVLYIAGQKSMTVITGKGDNVLVGAGYKTELDPDSKMATAKSRHKIYDAGFTRSEKGLARAIEAAEKGNPVVMKALGPVKRKEYDYPLEGVALELKPGQDPTLPKGGRREIYFDPKIDSPSFMLPVVATATEPDGREVEYYYFDKFKVPANFDWNPDNLGRKK